MKNVRVNKQQWGYANCATFTECPPSECSTALYNYSANDIWLRNKTNLHASQVLTAKTSKAGCVQSTSVPLLMCIRLGKC